MKIKIQSQTLKKALDSVSRIAAPKVSNNAYAGILLSAYKDNLEIQATDYQMSIRIQVPGEVEESGEVLVMTSYFPELIKKLSGEEIILSTNDKNMLHIQAGRSENEVVIGIANEFSRLEVLDSTQGITLPSDQIRDLYQQVRFAVGNEGLRPIYSGILLEAEGNSARMVATDTYRLACKEVSLDHTVDKKISFIIPEKVLAETVRLLPSEESVPVSLNWYRNYISFSFANIYFVSNLLEGNFPDYRKVFPQNFDAKATLNRKELTAALDRADLIARNMTYRTVNMKWSDKQLKLSVNSSDMGSIEDTIPCEYQGDDLEIVFNCSYLLDILKHSTGDNVTMNLLKNGPMLVEQEFDTLYKYLVTPMRGN